MRSGGLQAALLAAAAQWQPAGTSASTAVRHGVLQLDGLAVGLDGAGRQRPPISPALGVADCGVVGVCAWVDRGIGSPVVNMVSSVPASRVSARQLASSGSTIPSRAIGPPSRRSSRCLRSARSSR